MYSSYRNVATETAYTYIPCNNPCSSANQCLRDSKSASGSFCSPVLATYVELVQAETKLSCLKTDVMMTADRRSDLFLTVIFAIVFIVNQFIYSNNSYFIAIAIC